MRPELWSHQSEALIKASCVSGYGLFFEIGCGKSRTALELLLLHHEQGRKKALIFAPVVVLQNWKNEFLKYTDIPKEEIHIVYGSSKDRAERLHDISTRDSYYVITNYETTNMNGVCIVLRNMPFDVLVLDESHRCKTYNSKRTKVVTVIADQIKYKYLLSGTPILNSSMDIYSQFRIMLGHFPAPLVYAANGEKYSAIKELPITNFFHFRHHYFQDKNQYMRAQFKFPNWQPKPRALEEINYAIDKHSMRVKKSECLDLPPFIRKTYFVEMGQEQNAAYQSMKKNLIAFMKDSACVAQHVLTKALRLMQIVSGFAMLDDGRIERFTDNPRLSALKDLLMELAPNHKVIVWCAFKENYAMVRDICTDLGILSCELHGEVSRTDKEAAIQCFNENKDYRVMIANQMAGGIGVNLTASDFSIYYSRNFSLEGHLQSEGRNYRGGSEIHKSITRLDLLTPSSIDELILTALDKKQELSDKLLFEHINEL